MLGKSLVGKPKTNRILEDKLRQAMTNKEKQRHTKTKENLTGLTGFAV